MAEDRLDADEAVVMREKRETTVEASSMVLPLPLADGLMRTQLGSASARASAASSQYLPSCAQRYS